MPQGEREIEIGDMRDDESPHALAVIARAYVDDPAAISMLGDDPLTRYVKVHERFSHRLVRLTNPHPLVARYHGVVVGLLGMAAPGRCGRGSVPQSDPPTDAGNLASWERTQAWLTHWAEQDPAEDHWHIGPIAVEVIAQRAGIGSRLLSECCARLDAAHGLGFLDTTAPRNVPLYERFGFVVTDETEVLGTNNWTMRREAR